MTQETYTQREDCEETQGEDVHLQAKECLRLPEAKERTGTDPSLVPSWGAWPCQHLDFRLLVSKIVRL